MSKTNTSKTTADLIVGHAQSHLASETESLSGGSLAGVGVFSVAGLAVILLAFQLVSWSFRFEQQAFIAENARDYASQQAFYAGAEVEGAADTDLVAARESVHAAARAEEASRATSVLGFLLIIGVLYWLHRRHGILTANRAEFTIRRIR